MLDVITLLPAEAEAVSCKLEAEAVKSLVEKSHAHSELIGIANWNSEMAAELYNTLTQHAPQRLAC